MIFILCAAFQVILLLKELSSYIYDIANDCFALRADQFSIEIDEEPANDLLTILISTNINWQLFHSPSYKPSNVIPLLRQACDLCGGRFIVKHSESGSKLTASMQYHHADRPPMGSLPGLIQELIMLEPDTDISYTHRYDGREYRLSTSAIHSMLEGVPLDTPSVAQWIKERIGEGLVQIMREMASE